MSLKINSVKDLRKFIDNNLFEIAFFIAAGATLASFILSNIIDFIPCDLCWYQRILMFPLPLILGAAVLRRDRLAFVYTIPLIVIGLLVSAYHSLLQWAVIVIEESNCSLTGSSCADPEILWLGFLTIPFGTFLTFLILGVLMIRASKGKLNGVFDSRSQLSMQKMVVSLALLATIAIVAIRIVE